MGWPGSCGSIAPTDRLQARNQLADRLVGSISDLVPRKGPHILLDRFCSLVVSFLARSPEHRWKARLEN